jgi:hypothetical protein
MVRSIPAAAFGLVLAIGCTPQPHMALAPLHPVTGRVVNGGAAVKGGSVTFSRLNDQTPLIVNAAVDEAGHFELATLQDHMRHPGAPEGDYQVMYSPPVLGKGALPVTWAKTVTIAAKANEVVVDLADVN